MADESLQLKHLQAALSHRYRIERELGRGGMAVVYLARDKTLGRDVALKVLLPELTASIGAERFLREIEIAAKLSHPNILTLHDRGEVDGLLYYTMPYVDGESLRDRLDREKQLSIDEALTIAAEVAGALAHAHEQGVVHRDIKPENILLRDGHALVSDFGIAKAVTEAGGERLTQTGITVGTVSYMSPEQGSGDRDIDGRSDLYSLGCVLYEMIGGVPPFTGPSDQAILARHQLEAPPALSTIRATTPPGVEALIQQSLAKNSVDRYQTAEHMRVALSDPSIAAVGAGARLRRTVKSRMVRVAVAVTAMAAVAFGSWWLLPTRSGLNAGVIAVLPFEVEGEMKRPLDTESITNLLSNYFGYIQRYRVVSPEAVRQAAERLCPSPPIERICGRQVAMDLGAQFHVTGTVTPVGGDSVLIVAYLTDELERRSIPPVSIRGSLQDAYSALNELYRELAVAPASEGERAIANAALSTENMVAFAAFMDGELYLGQLAWDSAGIAFQRAVDNDSSYALAWYRLALVRDWFIDPVGAAEAAGQAEANGDRLSAHDRRLLLGYRAHIEGDPLTAEGIYLELLEEDPDDFEALVQLGYLYWGYSWRMDRTMTEVVEPMRRAMRLAPHPLAATYLPWGLAAGSAEDPTMLDEADSVAQAFGHPTFARTAIRAIMERDSLGIAAALDSIRDWPNRNELSRFDAMIASPQALRLATFVGHVPDLDMYIGLVESIADSADLERRGRASGFTGDSLVNGVNFWREWGYDQLAGYEAGLGRWRAVQDRMRAMDSWGDASTVRLARLATVPSVGPFPVDADSLLRDLEKWNFEGRPAQTQVGFSRGLRFTGHHVVMYLLGLLSAELGDFAAAGVYADRLEALGPLEATPTLHQDLALAVRADVLMRENRFEEALTMLDQAPWRVNNKISWDLPGEREKFLRAQALQGLGRYDEALRLYRPRGDRMLAPVLLAPSHYYRGQIYQELGDTEKALWHYGAFVELWKDADPEYRPIVQEVLGRMAQLAGEG